MVLLCWANEGLASCKKISYIDRGGSPHQLTGLDTLPWPFVAGLKRETENHSSNVCRCHIYIYIYIYMSSYRVFAIAFGSPATVPGNRARSLWCP